MNQQALSSFLWSVVDLLRGDYKQADYGKVILPFTVLRRIDCVLSPTKEAVLSGNAERTRQGLNPKANLLRKAGHGLNFQQVAGLWVALPSLDEQRMICSAVADQTVKLESLISSAVSAILLHERRTALISAAVTGKIDVRDALAPGMEAA